MLLKLDCNPNRRTQTDLQKPLLGAERRLDTLGHHQEHAQRGGRPTGLLVVGNRWGIGGEYIFCGLDVFSSQVAQLCRRAHVLESYRVILPSTDRRPAPHRALSLGAGLGLLESLDRGHQSRE